MSNDIERMLAAAADDTDQPLHTDIDDILTRGRRSVRRSRIAIASTSVLTTLAIVGGLTVWQGTLQQGEAPAKTPKSETITVDPKTGRITDNETGIQATLPPPASPLSDAAVLKRCRWSDSEYVQSNKERGSNAYDQAGPINAEWRVLVKSGDQKRLEALFLAPDRSIVSLCSQKDERGEGRSGRISTSILPFPKAMEGAPERRPLVVEAGLQVPAAGVAHVLVSLAGESAPRQALVGPEGYFTLGFPEWEEMRKIDPNSKAWDNYEPTVQRIRGYDANGKRIYDWKYVKVEPPKPTPIPADVKIKTQPQIEPKVVLTKDPENGKPLAVVPFSPLSDEQVRAECKKPDDSFIDGGKGAGDERPYDAGRISPDWQVALKVGSDKRFTALLVSPGQNVLAWCYRAEQGAYDYTRSGVQTDGTFGDPAKDEFSMWAMVPEGVAQIIVDLPTGPVRAAISNGYYLWGTTGGSENFKKVRVRGFDADAKLIYDQKISVDAS
ncbi:hypothetical protein GCM10029976_011300 [Kribbella albertanoniae]|uniref:Uncharacterized protein n=1 Tax=Kribbella albertanoniae TaxID=1266829 RepID=A0A4R4QCD4_9ACTN|nr:hypothetical protein [Kribbella albertanoniae]TDC32809.1 hypothetical protein E1261_07540 [Kribbella albertanoniae]